MVSSFVFLDTTGATGAIGLGWKRMRNRAKQALNRRFGTILGLIGPFFSQLPSQ